MDKDIQKSLAAPFDDADLEWRLQWSDDEKGSGIAVPYVTNRAIQNRLDKTVGAGGWKNEYIPWHSDGKKQSQICGISIYFEERKEWITKYDGAENSDIEPIKGGLSDSMKRAAVQWGIGRYLYSMDTVFVQTEKRGRSTSIKASEQHKLNKAHQEVVNRMFGKSNPPAVPQPPAAPQPSALVHQTAATAQQAAPPAAPQQLPVPATVAPQGVYRIMNAALQPTVKGTNNTHLQLQGLDGKTVEAHMQGENPGLVAGAWIMNAKISQITKEGVLFHILDEFHFMQQAAA